MTPLRLTSWFRKRMLVLAAFAMGTAWVTVTAGYHVQERREAVALCRGDAEHIASLIAEAIQQRPQLWRYDSAKLADRVADTWPGQKPVVRLRDARGAAVDLGAAEALPSRALWGRADVIVGGEVQARVWVGTDSAPLWWRTIALAVVSAAVAALLGILLYLLPVRAVRDAERRIDSLMKQLAVSWREEERGRIARELHDGAGQALTAARLHLVALKRNASPELGEHVASITSLLDEALEEVRRSTAALMPPALGDLGLRGAIERHCEAFGGATGLTILCEIGDEVPTAGSHIETACYRIVQEALTNIARHARAQRATVRLSARDDALHLSVEDDGSGMQTGATTDGVGLSSIRARAEGLGGEVAIHSSSSGTRLEVILPLPPG